MLRTASKALYIRCTPQENIHIFIERVKVGLLHGRTTDARISHVALRGRAALQWRYESRIRRIDPGGFDDRLCFATGSKELSYAHYSRGEELHTDPKIHVSSHDQFELTLAFQSPGGGTETPGSFVELRFPTGKYWSSQTAE